MLRFCLRRRFAEQRTTWMIYDFTDALGWGNTSYSSSIVLGDINGDGRCDLIGRNTSGVIFSFAP